MDEIERLLLAYEVRGARIQKFRTVKAAKDAAGVNTATWNRVESRERVRDDSVAAIVECLWPDTGGDYRQVLGRVPVSQRLQVLHDYVAELQHELHELQSEIYMLREQGGDPRRIDNLEVVVDTIRHDIARANVARDRAVVELEREPTVGAQGKDADSLLYRRPDGVSDAEWERIRDQSRDYIEWLIEKAARER